MGKSNKQTLVPGREIHVAGPLWLVPGEFGGRFPRCHCLYLDDGGGVLIDTGAGDKALAEFAARRPISLVLNTHTHVDHVLGNHLFDGRELLVPEMMAHTAGNLHKLSQRFVAPQLSSSWRDFIRDYTGWQDHRPTGTYGPHEKFQFGATRVETIFAPGHVADHCMFFLPDHGILLSADLDLTPFGPWYGNPESDLGQLRRSLKLAASLRPKMVASSHREPVSQDIDAEFARYSSVLQRREQALMEFFEEERTWEQTLEKGFIYGGATPFDLRLVRFFEDQMLSKHLAELLADGRVEPTEIGFRRV